MDYSLSAIEKSLLGAVDVSTDVGDSVAIMGRERMRERWAHIWDTASHVFVALVATVALATSLVILERAIQGPLMPDEGISRMHRIGRVVPARSVMPASNGYVVPSPVSNAAPAWHVFAGIKTVRAASGYNALVVSVEPSRVHLQSGESARVRVTAKNIGTETWRAAGPRFFSLYTWEPKYHVSPYRGPTWRSDHQVGALASDVRVGETGTMDFLVYAPPAFEGELTESFRLAVEDSAWVEGGTVKVGMAVGTVMGGIVEASLVTTDAVALSVSAQEAKGYAAALLLTSAHRVVARAGQPISFKALFQNTGETLWRGYELHSAQTALASEELSLAYHPSWQTANIALARSASIAPGTTETLDFVFRAPATDGSHTLRFQLVANGVTVPGGVLEIPVEVTGGSAQALDAPVREDRVVLDGEMIEMPRVRVGIDQVTSETIFSANGDVRVVEGDARVERAVVPSGQPMRAAWNGRQYVFESGGQVLVADAYVRFEGTAGADTVFTVSSFSDVRSWNTIYNDNTFRDTLELRYNTVKNRTWLINELPMNYYLYGLDETSGNAPEAYVKALVTAARTYALYMWEHKTKYEGEFIDMRSTTYDQVYHGHGAEVRRPSVVRAVDDTRGVTVQYAGQTIVASYFSRSDGRTRDWSTVWGKEVPYAKSVPVPCEVGRTMWGHGVGMSAGGALCMAQDGVSYDEILKYFYTNVDLVRRW